MTIMDLFIIDLTILETFRESVQEPCGPWIMLK